MCSCVLSLYIVCHGLFLMKLETFVNFCVSFYNFSHKVFKNSFDNIAKEQSTILSVKLSLCIFQNNFLREKMCNVDIKLTLFCFVGLHLSREILGQFLVILKYWVSL